MFNFGIISFQFFPPSKEDIEDLNTVNAKNNSVGSEKVNV